MASTDPAIKDWVDTTAAWLHYAAPVVGAAVVVVVGKWLARRAEAEEAKGPVVDLAKAQAPKDSQSQ
jgi:hypothetical protein